MALLIPIAVAAGLGVLFLATRPSASQKAAADKAKAAASSSGPTTFPPELQGELNRLLNPPADQDPAALETVATRLETLGFKEQATALRLKAAQLRAAQGAAPPAPPIPPQPPATPSGATPGAPPPAFTPGEITPFTPATGFTPGEITPLIASAVNVAPGLAVVTTSDPPPIGDLIVRSSPDASAAQIGGAEKGGFVTVVHPNADGAGVFAEIIWAGGTRWPPVQGFAKNAFLKPVTT
jgi:hypothetical protein